ncbi:ABCB family ABC transporter ATP-binding protein/permease [Litorimonas sp. RW-G-Af-16]|uniref:ABCB family ABC transporter ATP-binding protein/permease n=1 Tax=Litorimonas sp. RW-G-Af-16 TaxID=3241168 RepID=UPI00390C9936
MQPTEPTTRNEESLITQLKGLARLKPYLWPAGNLPFKLRSLAAIVLTIIGKFVLVGSPFLFGWAIDAVNTAQDNNGEWSAVWVGIVGFVLGYGLLKLFAVFLSEGREYIFAPVAQFAQRSVATATFRHMHQLSLRYHLDKRTGGLSRIIERGVRSIDFLFRFLLFNIGPTLLELTIAAVAFWLAYNGWFSVIAVAIVLSYILFTVTTTEWRLKFRREMNKRDTEAAGKAVDSLLNYETVKYFSAEDFETGRYDSAMEGYQEAAIRSRTSLATVNIGQSFLMNLGLVLVITLAGYETLAGSMTVGDITAVTMVMTQLYRPLNILGFAYREIKQALTDMEKMFTLMEQTPEVLDVPDAGKLGKVAGDIRFENVNFQYDADRPILKDVSFEIKPGQMVAVVGPTGAGKSTLSRILFRFYNLAGGRVLIDDQDITQVTQASVREAIGIVPQDTVLFNDTIGYNIAYAKPSASQDEIEQAARDAQIHDFILTLPKGYDTIVGERGLKLSGGEKQRVAIARTLLKDPAILILDEATSALDSGTERDIQAALEQAATNRTTLVIAHRLSTIERADLILVMEDGQIVERGTHEALLKQQGLYADLWARQKDLPAPELA